MSKYYAVAYGRKPGIYDTWDSCKEQVNKFSGAVYKSFTSLDAAEAYLESLGASIETQAPPKQKVVHNKDKKEVEGLEYIEIYSDGCHKKHSGNNYLGGGATCTYKGKTYKMSFEVDDDLLESYGIDPSIKVSNPTAEFLAFAEVLSCFYKQPLREGLCLRFWIDYDGVRKWMNGEQSTNKPYIRKIKEVCTKMLKEIDCEVEIHHVRGHQGNEGNEAADKLAKDESNCNDFYKLVKMLG